MFRSVLTLYRNAYSGLSAATWAQALIMLINRSGTMVIPFLTVYLTQALHFSIGVSGMVLSIFGLGAISGVFVGGKLTDRIGFFPVQFWSLLLNGVLFLILGTLKHLIPICGCVFLLAVIGESFRPANAAATAYYSNPHNRTRSYSLNRLAINLGFTIGPAMGGLLAGISYSLLFWTDGLTCIAAALVLRWLLRPRQSRAGMKELTPLPESRPALSAYKDRRYLLFIFFVWLFALCFFQLFSVIPLYFQRVIHMTTAAIGLILSMNGLLIAVIEMVLVYRLENKRPATLYVSYGIFLLAVSFLILGIGGPYIVTAAFFMLLMTFSEMLAMPFMNAFWIGRSELQNRGQYAALYGMAYSGAQVVAPVLGAQVVAIWGFKWLWSILVALALISWWGFRFRLGARSGLKGQPTSLRRSERRFPYPARSI
jgi:predicted MFS family arabinose efflux permease